MTKKHQQKLTEIASKIYDLATIEIQNYLNETYGDNPGDTFANQIEDFHVIADEVSAFLMGNAMALTHESCWDDDLKTLGQHVRKVATYAASKQQAELGPKH